LISIRPAAARDVVLRIAHEIIAVRERARMRFAFGTISPPKSANPANTSTVSARSFYLLISVCTMTHSKSNAQ
jgi:hypothetical protein